MAENAGLKQGRRIHQPFKPCRWIFILLTMRLDEKNSKVLIYRGRMDEMVGRTEMKALVLTPCLSNCWAHYNANLGPVTASTPSVKVTSSKFTP